MYLECGLPDMYIFPVEEDLKNMEVGFVVVCKINVCLISWMDCFGCALDDGKCNFCGDNYKYVEMALRVIINGFVALLISFDRFNIAG